MRHAGGRDSEEPREKPWKDRREPRETEGDRGGLEGGQETERDQRHGGRKRVQIRCIMLPRDKERCSGGVQNRQWRGWTAAGRSRGHEMLGRREQGEQGEKRGEGERERGRERGK